MNPAHVPRVYFERRCTSESAPSMPASTSSKSERSGGVTFEKSDSGMMSLSAYVSVMARSIIPSSSGVSTPRRILKSPTRLTMLERNTSSADSSSRGAASSNGLMWCGELSEMLKYFPAGGFREVLILPLGVHHNHVRSEHKGAQYL